MDNKQEELEATVQLESYNLVGIIWWHMKYDGMSRMIEALQLTTLICLEGKVRVGFALCVK